MEEKRKGSRLLSRNWENVPKKKEGKNWEEKKIAIHI